MSDQPQDAARRALLQNALKTVERLQSKLDAAERARHEPIAIVGLGCRFPGAADTADAYWRLLENGVDAVTEVPTDRWRPEAYVEIDPVAAAEMPVQHGGFLRRIDEFDPYFFGISPREAIWMDPQQRLVLEVAWEALESAAVAPSALRGTQTGVFLGITAGDYGFHAMQAGRSRMGVHIVSGITPNAAAGRVAYFLGLHGPCMAIDTACSSSLTAIHVACQSLRTGESNLALAGGVHALVRPEHFVTFHKWGMTAPDGRCKTFDASADGFIRAEGCGVLVLKRMRDALADGDRILAVIRGSSVNQDGASGGLTVPNGLAQQAVIRQALAAADVTPADIDYIEAHGTGTSLGDPIELEALDAVMGDGRPADRPLTVGSVKTNLGHLEAASGVASVIKVVLSLNHEQIPPHLHFKTLTPKATMRKLPLVVPTELTPWPKGDRRRLAGVSGFGFSGTNVHLVIEEAPARSSTPAAAADRPAHVVTLSARSDEALRALAGRWHAHVSANPELTPGDVGYTANVGRAHLTHRAALVATSSSQLADRLAALTAGDDVEGAYTGQVQEQGRAKVAFLFTGQGSQYASMGRALYDAQATFRQALDDCARLLEPHMDRPLLSVLNAEGSVLDQTVYTQPALFAVEYALAALWRAWGVTPDYVLGHSVGEYVAACVAGVMPLEDALRLIATRARLMNALPAGGAMAAVLTTEDRVRAQLRRYGRSISIAAINAPDNIVVSGEGQAVEALIVELRGEDVVCRPLTVSHAFHSALMEPMLDEFERVAASTRFSPPRVGLISNLTGRVLPDDQVVDAQYWRRHVREPVQFAAGMRTLAAHGCSVFIEAGPTPTLLALGRRSIPDTKALWLPSLRNGQEWREMLSSVARVYARGIDVDWRAFDRGYARQKIALPTYPFQRQRYWIDPEPRSELAALDAHSGAQHPLLGTRTDSALESTLFQSRVAAGSPPFLSDHVIAGAVLMPATAHVELAAQAGREVLGADAVLVEDLVIADALVLPVDRECLLQAVVAAQGEGAVSVQIFSREVGGEETAWRRHATAVVRSSSQTGATAAQRTLADARQGCLEPASVADYYEQLRHCGIEFGAAFRGIAELARGEFEAVGLVAPSLTDPDIAGYGIHPALLDGCLQVLGAAVPQAAAGAMSDVFLPVGADRVRLHRRAPARVWSHARIRPSEHGIAEAETLTGDITVFTEGGDVIATVEGLRLKRTSREALRSAAGVDAEQWLYEVIWTPSPAPATEAVAGARGTWVIFGDGDAIGTAVAGRLRASGATPIVVEPGTAFERTGEGQFTLDPASAADFERLLKEVEAGGGDALRGVLHLWSLAGPAAPAMPESAALQRGCGSLLFLAQALVRRATDMRPDLLVVTRAAQPVVDGPVDPNQAPVWGLARTLRIEHPELRCVTVDLDPVPSATDAELLWNAATNVGAANHVAFRQGRRYTARLVRCATRASEATDGAVPVELAISARGILENLGLRPIERRVPGAGEVEIQVLATGLNFRDVLNALGMYPGDPGPLGNECAGVITRVGDGVTDLVAGQKVIALTAGAFRSFVTTNAAVVAPIPAGMSAEEAATIPIVFMTAVYSLDRLAKLRRGQRVLIHAGAGGVGLAAIQIAQRVGAEIFATAGSPEKRAFLRSLGVPHVLDSRSLDFAGEIQTRTGGRGVDVVLNSLAGDFIPASMGALAQGGVFVELGKTGIWTDAQVAQRRPDVTYHVVYLGDLEAPVLGELLRAVVSEFVDAIYRPLPYKTFLLPHAADAFRYMAQARHTGKVIVTHAAHRQAAAPAAAVSPDGTYLITGGMGGLGLRVARWLVASGARHVALLGRTAPTSTAREAIATLSAAGAEVVALQADVSRAEDVDRAVATIQARMPRLRGIFHAAGTLDDGVLLQQDWQRFERVFAPKVAGAWHLHTRTLDAPLDMFVLFSSAASLVGAPGQGNYAAANAYLDALAHHRRSLGLAALSVNWGPWTDVGMAAAVSQQDHKRWARHGLGVIPADEGVRLLERLLGGSRAQVGVLPIERRKAAAAFAGPDGTRAPAEGQHVEAGGSHAVAAAGASGFLAEMRALAPARRRNAALAHVREQVGLVLDLDRGFALSPNQGLRELGMDSLMAVELRNRLQAMLGRSLPATLAFDFPTVEALTTYIVAQVLDQTPADRANAPERASADRIAIAADEPIAIVGMACRIPGGVETPEAFWRLLRDGVDAIREVPPDRWDVDAYYDPDPDAPGKMYTRHGGFVEHVDEFDARFFGISPREAVSMDPQQRLLLEVSWEALEHAGQPPDRLAGSRTGVFVGLSSADYAQIQIKGGDPARIDAYFGTGNSPSVAAGRLSYSLGLQGPAMSVDTACSSSLVAVHLACQSLRNGESRMALAGGVNLILSPDATINFSRARMLAADGRCKTFDADADGYVRGEGAGMVVLKRLRDAIADGDRVLAVIRGSAVNQDGRSSGLTVPNGPAQQALIREALAAAGVEPQHVSYVEAHGTGTSLGDPIEIQALAAALGGGRAPDNPLVVGSVKTNIGHLEAAAGVAGLIKVVLALQHREIPPHLHFRTLNPHISLDGFPAVIPTAVMPWSPAVGSRVAGISAFGFSGTNAHIVLEEAPAAEAGPSEVERPLHPITLSAKTEAALQAAAGELASHLSAHPQPLGDIAFTLNAGRAHLAHRIAFSAKALTDVQDTLEEIAAGRFPESVRRGFVEGVERPDIAFLFTGKGSPHVGVGRQLYETAAAFRHEIDRCDALLRPRLHQPLLTLLDPAAAAGRAVDEHTQAAFFALEYALAQLWLSWGVRPAIIVGHGVGECAAACVAGVFSLEDGLELAAAYGRPEALERVAAGIRYAAPSVPIISSVTGAVADGDAIASVSYWRRHSREATRFDDAIRTAMDQSCRVVVEIGAPPESPVKPRHDDWEQILDTVAALYTAGADIDWTAFERGYSRRKVELPTYPFERQRYWVDIDEADRPAPQPAGFTEVLAAGRRQEQEGPLDLAIHTYGAKWRLLDRLTTAYVTAVLCDFGVFAQPGETHTVDGLLERFAILPTYRKLLGRWLDRLVATGELRQEDDAFVCVRPLRPPAIDSMWEEASELSDAPAIADYIKRCGASLRRVITGAESPLETLFPGGSFHVAKALYEDSAPSRYINGIARGVVDAFARVRGAGQSLRVLEVGAGTGGTTGALLPALALARPTYWFTDLSEFFLARAQEKFAAFDFVRYGLLDIERDPEPQGYPSGGFDVIVAANVLHATSDLRKTLDHARQILSSGGLLVLSETTVHHGWFDITTGLIEGWQLFDDGIRTDNPLLTADTWQRVLLECGFEEAAAFPQAGSPAEILGSAIVVARAPIVDGRSTHPVDHDAAQPQTLRVAVSATKQDADGLMQRLRDAAPAEREDLLVAYVREHVTRVLRLEADAAPGRRQRLMDLGLDSLMAVELRNRLASGFGSPVSLPATLMFDYPTIDAIAAYLDRQLVAPESERSDQPTAADSASDELNEAAARLADVSEEEAEALLIQRLENL